MIDKYIAYIRDVRRYSARTQTLYEDALHKYEDWCGGKMDLIPSRIREYEGHLMEEGMKPRTVHLQMSALSGYCNYLIKEGVLKSNPVRTVKRPKMEKRLPEYYTENAMDAYLQESAHAAGEEELQILLTTDPQSKLAKELYERRLRRLIISILYTCGI